MLRPETFGQPEQFPEQQLAPQQQQQPTPPGQGQQTPPVVQPSGGSLAPGGIAATMMDLAAQMSQAASSQLSTDEPEYLPPPREASDPRFRPAGTPAGQTSYVYTGPGLVDDDGQILTDESGNTFYYNPSVDGSNLYMESTPAQRMRIIDMMERHGYAMDTMDQILGGYQRLFQFANEQGREIAAAIRLFESEFPEVDKPEPVYTVTSSADLAASFRQSFRNAAGREPDDNLVNRFVRSYQAEERAYGEALTTGEGAVTAPASLAVAGQQFAEETRPFLVDRQKELGSWNKFFNAIQGPWG
jgi:hypothetical protein